MIDITDVPRKKISDLPLKTSFDPADKLVVEDRANKTNYSLPLSVFVDMFRTLHIRHRNFTNGQFYAISPDLIADNFFEVDTTGWSTHLLDVQIPAASKCPGRLFTIQKTNSE